MRLKSRVRGKSLAGRFKVEANHGKRQAYPGCFVNMLLCDQGAKLPSA